MDLTTLSNDELQKAFMNVNREYIEILDGKPSDYINSKRFSDIRDRLHAVLDELQRRRGTK
jgi:hypothetical protein